MRRLFPIAILLTSLVLIVAGCGGSSSKPKAQVATPIKPAKIVYGQPVTASRLQLVAYEVEVGHHVYWIGPQKNFTYELTETKNGNSYVRYLPAGVKVGADPGKYTIIATYPSSNAYEAITADVAKHQMHSHPVSYHGIAAWSSQHPTSVYLVYPGLKQLIEVYDPSPAKAQKIAFSGSIEPLNKPGI